LSLAQGAERSRAAIRDGAKPLYDDVAALGDLPGRTAVVSNNQHATVEFIVDHYELTEHFDHVAGREPHLDGAYRRKPEAHYIERALDALGTRDALYVGDSPKDVTAAHRAGIDSAFVERPHREGIALDRAPTHRVADLRDLADRLG
jgi:phosphoglycolate phosphatase